MDRREFFRMLLAALTTLPFLSWLRPQETKAIRVDSGPVGREADITVVDDLAPDTHPIELIRDIRIEWPDGDSVSILRPKGQ